jgi:hypothetical protein
MRHRSSLILLAALAGGAAHAASPPDPAALAAVIDARLEAGWRKAGATPVETASDAAFLRRASLDLIGRIPTTAEVRDFLADPAPDKRARLVARLVDAGGHTRHMATFWRRTWVPQADTPEFARLADDFEAWAAARLQENAPYDRIVRELLTLPDPAPGRPGAVSPAGFFAAGEGKPENLAASATRAFLGVNLDCAQCHDHPFARWTRDQFWQTAAFFAPPGPGKGMPPRLPIPNTKKSVAAELLDGSEVRWPEAPTLFAGRNLLAGWVTARDNPYFARNAVNRLWANFYGTALVDPPDDLSAEAGSTGPNAELLRILADDFARHEFDLKYLTRALALTKAYQSAAAGREDATADARLFARLPVRGLTGEQLYDSLRTAAGLPLERGDTDRGLGLEDRRRFAARFLVGSPAAAERSITQALAVMNGRLTADLTDPARNPTLAGVADAPFLDTAGKIETLFLATLGRKPTPTEARRMADHVQSSRGPARALGDIFWALVNSTEFNTNH